MHQEQLAKWLLGTAALSTIIVPIGVDAILLANGHMKNPAWLPHAKLHCAMSFFAAVSLGGAAKRNFESSSGERSLLDGSCGISQLCVLDWINRRRILARNFLRVSK